MKRILLTLVLLCSILYSKAQFSGNALDFDGANDQVVFSTVPALFSNMGTNDFTIEAWVNPRGLAFSRIFFAQPSTTNFATVSTGSSNNIYFYVIVNGTTYSVATSANLPQNQWTHVAARWTANTTTPEVFFNGVLQAGAPGGTSSNGTSGLLTLGTRPGGAQYFNGALDEIRLWSEARSQCEIQANYQHSLSGPQTNLLLNYGCNHGTGGGANAGITTLVDNAGSSNNGTLTNFALSGTSSNWIVSTATITSSGNQVGGISISQSASVCSGGSYTFPDGSTQNNIVSTVTHVSTITSPGCDTLITTTVNVNPNYNQTDSATVCSGGSYTFPDGSTQSNITSPVIYTSLLQTGLGCDSIIISVVDVTAPVSVSESAAVCAGDSYTFPDGTVQSNITVPVTYTSVLQTSAGCDSLVVTSVAVNQPVQITLAVDFCAGNDYTFPDGTTMTNITQNVTQTSLLTTAAGCDSIIITNIAVVPLDTSVFVSGATLTASSFPGQTLQWVDCNNGYAPVSGAINQTFTPLVSGSYALVATGAFGCTDTSACRSVIVVGTEPVQPALALTLYPNPTHDRLTVSLGELAVGIAEIFDAQGQLIQRIAFHQSAFEVACNGWASGLYFIQVSAEGNTVTKKFRVE